MDNGEQSLLSREEKSRDTPPWEGSQKGELLEVPLSRGFIKVLISWLK
jgi:hypothetical protein